MILVTVVMHVQYPKQLLNFQVENRSVRQLKLNLCGVLASRVRSIYLSVPS